MKFKVLLLGLCVCLGAMSCGTSSNSSTNNAEGTQKMKEMVCDHKENSYCVTACGCLPITTDNADSCGMAYALCVQDTL